LVIVVALSIIILTGGQNEVSNTLTPADSLDSIDKKRAYRDSFPRRRSYVRTKVVYRDRPYREYRHRSSTEQRDSFVPRYPVKIKENEHMVLNGADSAALQKVPGIGPYFARQILRYGSRLGGYVNIDQLDEIEDFPTESKRFFVIENPSPQKLNVNKLSLYELKRHPYINFYQARAITDYRRLHGPIKSLDELRLLKDFPQEAIDRLIPYIEY